MRPTLATALQLRAAGLACIPCKADKRPVIAWQRFQRELPTEAELETFFSNGSAIALVAGVVTCIDFDEKYQAGIARAFMLRAEECGLGEVVDRLILQRTPSGGYHLVFRCDTHPVGNLKLACKKSHEVLIETRGAGGYFLIAPSERYELVRGAWSSIPAITEEERDELLSLARSFDERPPKEQTLPSLGSDATPGDDFDSRGDLPALLRQHGWKSSGGSGKYWTRPGKDRGISASLGHIPGRFWVFSTSTPFEPQHVYRPWHVFAVLECNGDFAEAAKRLRKLGFGGDRELPRQTATAGSCAGDPPAVETAAPSAKPVIELPPIRAWEEIEAEPPSRPAEIIAGVLFAGAKGMIAGPSKSHKTFTLTALAFAAAGGAAWLGFKVQQCPVLYLNLELQEYSFWDRGHTIAPKVVQHVPNEMLFVWTLRGFGVSLPLLRGQILSVCKAYGVGLIIIDPTYKLNQGGEENAAEDVGRRLNEFEMMGRETGAAVVFAHHFAKGDASAKNSIDRASGSGVWARDPDMIMTFTPSKEADDCMIVESHLRNFKPIDPFAVRWVYPVWERVTEFDPEVEKAKRGPKVTFTAEHLDAILGRFGGAVTRANEAAICSSAGISRPTLYRRWAELKRLRKAVE